MRFQKMFGVLLICLPLMMLLPHGNVLGLTAMKHYQSAIKDYHAIQGGDTISLGKRLDCLSRMLIQLKTLNDASAKDVIPILKDLSRRINEQYPRYGSSFGAQFCYGFCLLSWNDRQPRFAAGRVRPAIWLESGHIDCNENSFLAPAMNQRLPNPIYQWAMASSGGGSSPPSNIISLDIVAKIGDAAGLVNAFKQIQKAAEQCVDSPPEAPFYVRIESQKQTDNYFVFFDNTPHILLSLPLKSFLDDDERKRKQRLLALVSARYGPPPPPKPPHPYYIGYYYDDDDDNYEPQKQKIIQPVKISTGKSFPSFLNSYNVSKGSETEENRKKKGNYINVETCNPNDPDCEQWRSYSVQCACFVN